MCVRKPSDRVSALDFSEDEVHTPKAFANFSPGFERSENPGNEVIDPIQP